MKSNTRLAYAALSLGVFGWGSLHVAAKPVVPYVGAVLIALDRTTIAALLLSLICIVRDRDARSLWTELRERPLPLLVLGIFSFYASAILTLAALHYLPASVNTILNNLGPLWLALATVFTAQARRPLVLIAGSTIALGGVLILLLPEAVGTIGGLDWRGVCLSVASSLVIAGQAVIGRRIMPGHDALTVTASSAALTVPLLLVTALLTGGLDPLVAAPSSVYLLLVYLGIFCTSFNFAAFNFALKHLSATRASNVTYLVPVVGVALAVLLLHEPAGWNLLAGLLCTFSGIVLAHKGAEGRVAAGDLAERGGSGAVTAAPPRRKARDATKPTGPM
jgi:drug/metabolite transporter (DMT)-like permease